MADVSHRPGDLTTHPDVSEMRARFARTLSGRDVVFLDGPVLLAGLYCAISPWTVHFSSTSSELLINNLVLGITIALMGLCLTMAPARTYGLSWAMSAIGVWLIISPWVVTVGHTATAGLIWNQVVIGAVTFLLGALCAASVAKTRGAAAATSARPAAM